jgi:hypothetical protein
MSRVRRLSTRTAVFLCVALAAAAAADSPVSAQAQKLPITWGAPSAAVRGTVGAALAVEVSARIDDGWHLYSLTQPPPPDPTAISVPAGQPFTLSGSVEAPLPEKGFDAAQNADTEYYTEAVTFRLPLAVEKSAKPGAHKVTVIAKWQACNGSLCLRPQTTTIEVPVQLDPAK